MATLCFQPPFGAYSRSILDPSNQGRLFFVLFSPSESCPLQLKFFKSEIRYSIRHGTSNCYYILESLSKDIGTFRADCMLCRVDGCFDSSIKKKGVGVEAIIGSETFIIHRLGYVLELSIGCRVFWFDMNWHRRIRESW